MNQHEKDPNTRENWANDKARHTGKLQNRKGHSTEDETSDKYGLAKTEMRLNGERGN